jgi:hypothetical protein
MSATWKPERRSTFAVWVAVLIAVYVVGGLLTWRRTLLPDEIRPLLLAAGPFRDQLAVARGDLVQTPAAWVMARLWLDVFGQTDVAAKSFALVLGIGTLILYSILARRVTRHWRYAMLLAGAVFLRAGSSPNLVRMYGLTMLCCVAAMLLWDVWRGRGGGGWLAGWVICMAVAINAHALVLLLLPAFVLATWLDGRRRLLFTAVAVLPALSLVPWVLLVLPVYRERGVEANVKSIADDPVKATAKLPFYFLSGEPPGTESPLEELYIAHPVPSSLKWSSLLLCVGIMGFSYGSRLVRRPGSGGPSGGSATRDRGLLAATGDPPVGSDAEASHPVTAGTVDGGASPGWERISVVLAAVPIGLLCLVSVIWLPIVTARYLLGMVPAMWLMLVIHGHRGGWPGRLALGLVAAWMLASAGLAIRLNRPMAPARIAATRVAAEHQAGDLILIDRHNPLGWQFTWEWTRRLGRDEMPVIIDSPNRPEWLKGLLPGPMLDTFDPAGAPRVWFVHWVPGLRDRIGDRLTGFGYRETEYGEPDVAVLSLFVRESGPQSGGSSIVQATTAALERPY